MSASPKINHRTTHVILRSCSCTTCTHPHKNTNQHTHTHTHTHERTRTWTAAFAFILRKTEAPCPLPSFTPSSLKRERRWERGVTLMMDLGATAHHVPPRRVGELVAFLPQEVLALLCCCSALYFPGAFADSGRFAVAALPSTIDARQNARLLLIVYRVTRLLNKG
jgi:hypothetical protein